MPYKASAATTAAAMRANADEAPTNADPELGRFVAVSGRPVVGDGPEPDKVLLLLLLSPVPAAVAGTPVITTFLEASL